MVSNDNNDNEKIEKFKLPRLDWYDNEGIDTESGEIIGRLYKDALIENFNAIEDKSIEIQGVDVFDIPIPEPSGIEYPDTTLDSDLNQVVNLASLIQICNLSGYPIKLSFTGTTCTELVYYQYKNISKNQDWTIIKKTNIPTNASNSNPYIWLDTDNQTLVSTSTPYLTSPNGHFIGMYVAGRVIHQRSQLYPNSTIVKGS